MERRDFIQMGIIAAMGMAALPKLIRPKPQYHFIAICYLGEQILEAIHKHGLRGRFTWIKDQDSNRCDVPDVNRITIETTSTEEYFIANRISKMPESYVDEIPDWSSILNKAEITIVLTQPTCYLGMYLPALLSTFLYENNYPYHNIGIQPFRFYSQREKDAASFAFQHLSNYKGKLSTVFADSIRNKGKMNLAVAFELLYLRVFEETECVLNRINHG